MTRSEVADRFLTALAALELCADAAHVQPLLIVVDDAHWLDTPTVEALAFIARRIDSEPIVLLVAVRAGYPTQLSSAQLPQLDLLALDAVASAALLHRQNPVLARQLRDRILNAAAGNPLALVELPAALLSLADEGLAADPLPLTERLQSAFTARFADLPVATSLLLLVAAANDADSIAEALRATSRLTEGEVSTECLEPAAAAGLILLDVNRVRFRHPLVRSGVYQTATLSERRRVHLALADTLVGSADRRAWHLAASTVAPGDAIAEEIIHAAKRAEARGGTAVAVDAFARSAELSVDPRPPRPATAARRGPRPADRRDGPICRAARRRRDQSTQPLRTSPS